MSVPLNSPADQTSVSERSEVEEAQRTYYNRIAEDYEKHYGNEESLRYREWLFNRQFRGIDLSGKHVLDAMCGGGENSAFFAKHGCRLSGIDISENQCSHYSRRFPQAEVVCGSAFDCPWEDATFDLIIVESLHHLHPNVKKGLQEFTRLLKPGGYLAIWEPSAGSLLDAARKLWYRLDSKYFEKNEQSIDFKPLLTNLSKQFEVKNFRYGGNLAYLFVMSSMHFRIPVEWVKYYSGFLLRLEPILECLQGKLLAIWGFALLKKKPS